MRPNRIVLIAALVALVAKLYCAAMTVGTNDTVFFYGFGKLINQHGLAYVYEHVTIFNHTPLVGAYAALLQRIEPGTQVKMELLPFFLRLPGIIADFLSVFVLIRLRTKIGGPPWWAIGLFALSPVAFMVSGFHGNVDSVVAFLLLTAAWLAAEEKPALCGVALGLACSVKVAPLLLGPVFFMWWWHRKDRCAWRPFLLAVSLVTLAGWAPALLGTPRAFLGNVLGYQGYWGIWGLSWCLKQTGAETFQKVGFEQLTDAQSRNGNHARRSLRPNHHMKKTGPSSSGATFTLHATPNAKPQSAGFFSAASHAAVSKRNASTESTFP